MKTVRSGFPVSVDEIYVEIAKHVKAGLYRFVSVSVSAYSFVIVCISELNSDEFMDLSFKTFFNAES